MKIKCTDLNYDAYDVYLGPELFKKGKVLEASEEDGMIIYEDKVPSGWYQTTVKERRVFGKVYIVRTK